MLYTNCEVIQIKFTIIFFYREKCSLEIMRFFFLKSRVKNVKNVNNEN